MERVGVAIVGTGFAGLGTAIRLKQAGFDDFVVLERADDVGGTWRDNSYPGCQCDVPSNLYSFSFAPNPNWTNTFPLQPEIWDYLRDCAVRFGVVSHIRLGHEVLNARWDEPSARWQVHSSQGDLAARFLVLGQGPLSDPSLPDIPGLDGFQGTVFHSARWRHDHDLTGERVAVVGTGASAIQFIPEIQPRVGALQLYQRTAAWVMPHPKRPVSAAERWFYRSVPGVQRLLRGTTYMTRESFVLVFTGHPRVTRIAERLGLRHLRRQVPDAQLRRKLTPTYHVGCKRILISNDYYPALMQPNVEVITDGIREVRPHSIVAADGTERDVDTIIFGTGFQVTNPPIAQRVCGKEHRLLAEVWGGSPQAYRGTTVAGFPNMFLLAGPNTGLGHTSLVFMIESQIAYVLDALRTLGRHGAGVFDVRPAAQERYNETVQQRLRNTVWNTGGCASWYLDANGRNSALWPTFTWPFHRRTARFDTDAYELRPAQAA